jgi:hypothetical protein
MKYKSYFLLFVVVLMAFFPSVYESYAKLTADSVMLTPQISDDKAYRADVFYTNKLPLRIFASEDDASLSRYKFIRIYDNKTGKFIGESNLCASRELAMSFGETRVWYGDTSEREGKGLFGYTAECIVKIK